MGVTLPEQQGRTVRLGAGKALRVNWSGQEQEECDMVGIIVWLIVGGVVGWLASIVMRTDAQQGILLNIVVGIIGAFLAGLIVGGGSINDNITVMSFIWSLLGAIVLLAIVNLVRRGSVR
jgi:uncharacterized membrane protein YeaQ/YmgE (transglycosylase-associated protein family)